MTSELQLASAAARSAGEVLRREFSAGSVVNAEFGKDIKLEADVRAEAVILEMLRRESAHAILSEEAGADAGYSDSGTRWVVDPLDGTFNFSRRLPSCCVSIGLCDGSVPRLGVIYDFLADVIYEGEINQGAWRNGAPMRVSSVATAEKAALCTGFPAGRTFGRDSLMGFVEQARTYKKVRLIGSAAMSLAYVASGVVEAYHEDGINFWDVAAGLALVKAAGGRWAARPGAQRFQMEVFADNGKLTLPEQLGESVL
jgi:myo-inositol-1(or 4)-monophosphatase